MAYIAEFTDNFNRTNQQGLGTDYLVANNTVYVCYDMKTNSGRLDISNNTAVAGAYSSQVTTDAGVKLNTTPTAADQYIQMVLSNISDTINRQMFLSLRCSDPTSATQYVLVPQLQQAAYFIGRRVNGSWQTIASGSLNTAVRTNGKVHRFQAVTNGTQVDLKYIVDEVERAAYSDTAANRITDNGRVEFGMKNYTDTSSIVVDDLEMGTIGEAPPASTFIPKVVMF